MGRGSGVTVGNLALLRGVRERRPVGRRGRSWFSAALGLVLLALTASNAAAQPTQVTAVWDANNDGVTLGYVVYYGTSPGSYQWSLDAGAQTQASLTVNRGSRYFFTVRAYNASAMLGPASNEATIDLPASPSAPTAQLTATLVNNDTAVLNWTTSNAVSVTINGITVPVNGTVSVPVSSTTNFTLVATSATGATDTVFATVIVTPPPGAPTATFSAMLQNYDTAVLTWSTSNAVSVVINGMAMALEGSVSIPVSSTTNFTLVATSASGQIDTKYATVVLTPTATAPTAAISATLVNGDTAILSWTTDNAVRVTLNGVDVALNGTMSRHTWSTTTFTLVATSASGEVDTKFATVVVTPQPGSVTASIAAALADGDTRVVLTWTTQNAERVVINLVPVPLTGTMTVLLAESGVNFTIVATAADGSIDTKYATVYPTTPPPSVSAVPHAPVNVAATVNQSLATLSWLPSSGGPAPQRYLLYVGTRSGTNNIADSYDVGTLQSITGQLPKGRYFARVRAANGAGVSDASAEVIITIGTRLASPSGFTVRWSGTTATLEWSRVQSDESSRAVSEPVAYVIEAGSAPGLSDVGTLYLGEATSFSAAVPSGTYYVRVRAVSPNGESDPTTDMVVTAPGVPEAPTSLRASSTGGNVTLHWDAPTAGTPPTGYVIEAGSQPGLADVALAQVDGTVRSVSVAVPTQSSYYLRVRALSATGIGQASNEIVVTP